MIRAMLRRILIVLLALTPLAPAIAKESAPVSSRHTVATLVTDTDGWQPGHVFHAALRLRLAPGWHTYWLNPGAAGAPPELKLALPAGASAGRIAWPAPERLPEGPLMAYAYTGDVLLPVPITPPPGGGDLPIRASASWLVCAQICVPEQGDFTLDLPAGQATSSAEAPLFAAAEARLPRASDLAASIAPDGTLAVDGPAISAATIAGASFFPLAPGALDDAAAQPLTVRRGSLSLGLKPGQDFHADAALEGVLELTAPGGGQRVLAIRAAPGGAPAPASLPFGRALLFAFLGGLILNLMPCVFPVLAMKAVGLAGVSGVERRRVRLQAASYTAGVLLAFTALGMVLLALRQAGSAAGWGFQFQSPIFVAAMAWLLFAVGLNLSGAFELGGVLAGVGQGLAGRAGHVGSFFTGLLAVLVATPCTAPFMGAAIAGALAAPAPVTLAVFLTLGLGLAAPYALLALVPRLAAALPRPGPWMLVLKQLLAFPMYGAAAWLLWVVSQEAGSQGVLGTAAGLVLLGFAGWALGAATHLRGNGRRTARAAALAGLLAMAAILPGIAAAPGPAAEPGTEAFTPARLAALRAEGRPVFVNMTAAWCLTCLVNERIALAPREVRDAFAAHDVAYLRGDWTRQDPSITDFLRVNGRDGVPLYVFFPARGAAEVLPQLLTAETVLRAVAGG